MWWQHKLATTSAEKSFDLSRIFPVETGREGNCRQRKEMCTSKIHKRAHQGFPGGSVVKNPPANAGGTGSIPVLGREDPTQSS